MNIFKQKIVVLLMIFTLLLPTLAVNASDELIITNIKTTVLNDGKVKIVWNTDVNSTGRVEYGLGSWYLNAYVESNQSKRYHEVILGNLVSNTKYYYQITAKNNNGQSVSFIQSFKVAVFKNKTAPHITNAEVDYVAGTVAVVSWQTDEPATTYLEYGLYESYTKSIYGRSRVDNHLVIIKNLKPNTKYSVRFNSTDKDGNRSSTHMRDFTTFASSNIDNEKLAIKKFNPNSANDPGVSDTEITVKFTSNHWAKARVTFSAPGKKIQTKQLDYEINHELEFDDLSPSTDYKITVRLDDVFGKSFSEEFMVKTKAHVSQISANSVDQDIVINNISKAVNISGNGFYGRYYDLDKLTRLSKDTTSPFTTNWFEEENITFTQYEEDLMFGCQSFSIPSKLTQGRGFTAHWSGVIYAPESGVYSFEMRSDDDSWLYIDSKLVVDLGGLHRARFKEYKYQIKKGYHSIDVYYAERMGNWGCFDLRMPNFLSVSPYGQNQSDGLTVIDNYNPNTKTTNNKLNNNIVVAGLEHLRYTQASALVKTEKSPAIYAVVNGMCHYVSSPQSFNEYGYQWGDIEVISQKEFDECPRARLLKSPDRSTIYYLYQRPQDKWLKIDILSPTVFVSYPDNYWGNVITVNDFDINSYPNVKLIRAYDNNEVYFVENNVKHFVSDKVFKAKGFNPYEVVIVSQVHFKGYKKGKALK